MKTHAFLAIIALAAALAVSGCAQNGQQKSVYFEGKFEVLAPGYYTELKMDNAGYMNITKNIGMQQIAANSRMQPAQLDSLKGMLAGSDFFSLKDSYVDWDVDNGTSYILTLTLGNRTSRVLCYETCPDSALGIRNKIQEYWGEAL